MEHLKLIYFSVSVIAGLALVARQLELRWPIDTRLSNREVIADWKVTLLNVAVSKLVLPFAAILGGVIISAVGGGFIHLRTDGGWYAASLICLVVAGDL